LGVGRESIVSSLSGRAVLDKSRSSRVRKAAEARRGATERLLYWHDDSDGAEKVVRGVSESGLRMETSVLRYLVRSDDSFRFRGQRRQTTPFIDHWPANKLIEFLEYRT
jgi:hypothetical protein